MGLYDLEEILDLFSIEKNLGLSGLVGTLDLFRIEEMLGIYGLQETLGLYGREANNVWISGVSKTFGPLAMVSKEVWTSMAWKEQWPCMASKELVMSLAS